MAYDRAQSTLTSSMRNLKVNPNCDGCDVTDVSSWCSQCDMTLCTRCTQSHKRLPTTKSHKLQQLQDVKNEGLTTGPGSGSMLLKKCREHNKNITHFCETCNSMLCVACVSTIGPHNGHQMIQIDDACTQLQKLCIDNLGQSFKQLTDLRANVSPNAKDSIGQGLKQAKTELYKRSKELFDLITRHYQKALKDIDSQLDETNQAYKALEDNIDRGISKSEELDSDLAAARRSNDIPTLVSANLKFSHLYPEIWAANARSVSDVPNPTMDQLLCPSLNVNAVKVSLEQVMSVQKPQSEIFNSPVDELADFTYHSPVDELADFTYHPQSALCTSCGEQIQRGFAFCTECKQLNTSFRPFFDL